MNHRQCGTIHKFYSSIEAMVQVDWNRDWKDAAFDIISAFGRPKKKKPSVFHRTREVSLPTSLLNKMWQSRMRFPRSTQRFLYQKAGGNLILIFLGSRQMVSRKFKYVRTSRRIQFRVKYTHAFIFGHPILVQKSTQISDNLCASHIFSGD